MKKLHSFSAIARILGVDPKTLKKSKQNLPGAVMVGRRVLYPEESVLEFIKNGGVLGASVAPGAALSARQPIA